MADAEDENNPLSGEEDDSMSNDDGSNSNDGSNCHDGSGQNSNDDESAGSGRTSAESSGSGGGSNESNSSAQSSSNDKSNKESAATDPTSSDNFERSESCGSDNGGDSPLPDGSDMERGFISNYGPSKTAGAKSNHRLKRTLSGSERAETAEGVVNHDAQSGLYGPSKQAHDAKIKIRQAASPELDFSYDHLLPI